MKDVQNQRPDNPLYIQKVGVKGISYPIVVSDKKKGTQNTVASINLYVDLPREFKGTHMSRFIEVLNEHRKDIHIKNFEHILNEIKHALEAESAHMEIFFPYFIEKKAPVTGSVGLMEYTCCLMGMVGRSREFKVMVKVPIQTLCPCSKEISDYGAHNQRGIVSVVVRYEKFFWIEDLIELIEGCSSSQVYPILKRPDEKFLTEHAYDHPMFVEDVVRQVASLLNERDEFSWYSVEAENFESIHNHSAYACIESRDHG
ncbi:MAG TPA: GTP cyclohydrolase FolE2 [Deltaproteobacteria bacterium]|nr:GTP cyclohydrolase FolE2 [Deltaproteobacteria bacterium]HPJ93922.1 GTP cyclohydrolase FolE2 [Deltaproteobacteria bacterium]HPR51631.1 GTP cyclohydrolase FolE2 [Deltaproteobacteria bacterium]